MKYITALKVASLAFMPTIAVAADFIPHALLGTSYTDNALGEHSNPTAEQTINALAGVVVRHNGPRTSLNGDLDIGRREFTREDLPAENLSAGFMNGSLLLVPERLTWEAEEGYGRANSRSFTALSEVDENDVNYFRTGPDARFVLADRYSVNLSGRFVDTRFSASDIDSQRYSGDFGVARILSQTSQLGAAYASRKIDYTSNASYPGARIEIGHANYTVNSSRMFFVVEAGSESLHTDSGEHRTTPHGLFGIQRAVSRRVTLNLEYQHGFSDVSDTLRSNMTDRFQQGLDSNVRAVALPFTVDTAYFMVIRSGGRLLVAAQTSWLRENYGPAGAIYNLQSLGVNLTGFYRLNSKWGVEAMARWVSDTRVATDAENHLFNASFGIYRTLSRSLQVGLVAERSVNHGVTVAEDISETRVTLAISYAPQAREQPMFTAPTQLRTYQRTGVARPGQQQAPLTPSRTP